MSRSRLILIRHGETEWNAQGRYQGHLDSPLTTEGVEQAERLALRLADAPIDAIYSSDLARALRTAQLIAKPRGSEIAIDATLRERCLGELQGLSKEEAHAKMGVEDISSVSHDPAYSEHGVESMIDFQERVYQALSRIATRHPDQTVAVVFHGGCLAVALRKILGIALDAPRMFGIRNCSLSVFEYDGEKFMMEVWGDTSHLEERSNDDDSA